MVILMGRSLVFLSLYLLSACVWSLTMFVNCLLNACAFCLFVMAMCVLNVIVVFGAWRLFVI